MLEEGSPWRKLIHSPNRWWRLRRKSTQAAWSRLPEISILRLNGALPQHCISVSNLMLFIKKSAQMIKAVVPPIKSASVLLTYMCRYLFCDTWRVIHTAYLMGLWTRCYNQNDPYNVPTWSALKSRFLSMEISLQHFLLWLLNQLICASFQLDL